MFVLGKEELKLAENMLKGLFPESVKVYGCLFNINRGKPHNLEVIADSWPDFRVIICKQKQSTQDSLDREGDFNIYSIYSKDKESLHKLLGASGIVSWNRFTLLAGVDINHLDAVKELAVQNNTPTETVASMFVLMLEDASHLKDPECDFTSRITPLTPSHAELVNSNWKYGGDACSYRSVLNYISNYPSLCVMDESGRPVSWLLLYPHCALGLLYTMPQHRRKGYAKQLITIMARHLLEQGHPVYCFVEEGNDMSYRLFTSLGFRHKPDYRAVWFQLNL
ncbi:glycine N-acyltransferase-like protein 3 isoform X1 [Megalops cyprinoides]|uniref:glycine N-acyltransferase-like protein 3 isoform X1 n=1 Tax=Megalops cyprinoides TaxID=118141 RepID=UPI0018649654|nr:glycine N-acyltransferase-like protein 3 isoform X1 [Megalops cyprinoides]